MAGYSGTPLAQKLGMKEGARVGLVRPPAHFEVTLGALPEGVAPQAVGRGKRRSSNEWTPPRVSGCRGPRSHRAC